MLWMKEGVVAGDMKLEHGWGFTTKTGIYGTNYMQRALVTAIGLGANRPQDAVYPTSEGPNVLEPYTGAKKYVMHFPKGELPPVKGFWSLTMYDKDYFFVDEPDQPPERQRPAETRNQTPTARSISTSKTRARARTRNRTGCRRRRTNSS